MELRKSLSFIASADQDGGIESQFVCFFLCFGFYLASFSNTLATKGL